MLCVFTAAAARCCAMMPRTQELSRDSELDLERCAQQAVVVDRPAAAGDAQKAAAMMQPAAQPSTTTAGGGALRRTTKKPRRLLRTSLRAGPHAGSSC